MMTGWPRLSDSFWPTIRAMMSLPPPGVKPTTMWIACVGYFDGSSCARTAVARAVSARQAPTTTFLRNVFMGSEPCDLHMKHGGLTIVEHGETSIDRRCKFVGFGRAFAMRAERLRDGRKIPPLALAA